MGASIALAGMAGCTRQPPEQIIPYVRQPEDIVPGKPLFYATAMTLGGRATGLLVESHEGRPTKIEGNPLHPASLGATDVFAQAALLDLYDPDRMQTLTNIGEILPWSAFIGAMRTAATAQQATKGAGLRILTETVCSPTLAAQMEEICSRASLRRTWHQWDPASELNARRRPAPGLRRRRGGALQRRTRGGDRCARRRFLRLRPGTSALRAAVRGAAAAGGRRLPAVRGRKHADDDGRESGSPAASEAEPDRIARASAGGRSRRRRRQRGAALPADGAGVVDGRAQRAERASRLEHRRRGRRTAAGRARPRACDERGARQRRPDGSLHRSRSKRGPVDQVQSIRELAAAMAAGQVDTLLIIGGNPVYTAPADLRFAERWTRCACAFTEPARERDVGALPLADSRSALPRGVERRARVRRHGVDRPAADRSALRRPVRARSARGPQRSSRAVGVSDRPRVLAERGVEVRRGASGATGRQPRRPEIRSVLAAHRPRRRDGGHCPALSYDCVARFDAAFAAAPAGRRAASRSPSAPIRRFSTAASPTTRGCRSCRNR